MASYKIEVTKSAEKQLRKITKRDRAPVVEAMSCLSSDPRPKGCRKLRGYETIYRIRVGRYRIVYEIYDKKIVVVVLKIGHRKDVYR